jgi:ADP-L-glycero-D-manno-heptose 6-epimerase
MKILVTGHKGFIGKNLFNKLVLDEDNIVKGIEDDIFDKLEWREYLISFLKDFIPDVIFHVGACSDTMEQNVNYMMIRNYEFTKIISEWSYVENKKFIYSSSAAIYGENGKYPSNLYGWSKYVGEDISFINGGVNLRYFNVYGPGEEHKGKMASVVYQMYLKYKNNEEVKLFPGRPKRDFVYIDDVVDANIFALRNFDILHDRFYEVGSGESRLFEDMLDIMNIPYTYHNENMIPSGYQFETKSSLFMNDWSPKFNIENGLKKYKEYLEK